MRQRLPLTLFLLGIIAGLFACTPKVPIPVLNYTKTEGIQQPNLLILLRGRGGSHHDFEKFGIIDEVRKHDLPFDIIVPDAHFGYYFSETLDERIKIDIVNPAREKGYHKIWLAGFSMGGLGSLFYLVNYPGQDIDGVILCSPFLGGEILTEIEVQGGLERWNPPPRNKQWQYRLWSWIRHYRNHPVDYPPIFLGYARDDSITGKGPALFASTLRPENVFSVPGGHDYPTFQTIWRIHLQRLASSGQFPAPTGSSVAPPVE